jgi:hypothetical protein
VKLARPPPHFYLGIIPGVYRVYEFKKDKKIKSKIKRSHGPTLDIHAERRENNCLYEYRHGCVDGMAGYPIEGLDRRDFMGITLWRFDLGDFLW